VLTIGIGLGTSPCAHILDAVNVLEENQSRTTKNPLDGGYPNYEMKHNEDHVKEAFGV